MPATALLRVPLSLLALASVFMVLRFPDERTPWWGISGNLLDINVYRWGGHAILNQIPLYGGLLSGDDSGTDDNLAGLMLPCWPKRPVTWKDQTVRFAPDGSFVDQQAQEQPTR